MTWSDTGYFVHSDGVRAKYPESSRCTASRKSDGRRCGMRALKGRDKCEFHGGRHPKSVLSVDRRLLAKAVRDCLRWRASLGWPTTEDGLRAEALSHARGRPVVSVLSDPGDPASPIELVAAPFAPPAIQTQLVDSTPELRVPSTDEEPTP